MRLVYAFFTLLPLACTTTYRAPEILSFTATPQQVESGKTVEFNWTVTGYTRLFLDQGVGEVTNLNHKTIIPTTTHTYTLLAVGRGGESTASIQVKVFAFGEAQ